MASEHIERLKKEFVESHRISLGAVAIAMAIVVTLLQVSTLTDNLRYALTLFALAVPMLTFMILADEAGLQINEGWPTVAMNFLYLGALILVWAGLVCTVAHLDELCGFLFLGASVFGAVLLGLCYRGSK